MRRTVGQRLLRRCAEYMRAVLRGTPCLFAALAIPLLGLLCQDAAVVSASGGRSGQPSTPGASIRVEGRVLELSSEKSSERSVPDAVVTLCHEPAGASPSLECESVATTVSDAHGAFELTLDRPVASVRPYTLRVEGPEGQRTESRLSGNPEEWPPSVKLVMEKAATDHERLAETTTQLRRQLAALKRNQAGFKDQQDKLNHDLGKIFEQQERQRHQAGINTHRVLFGTDRAVSSAADPTKLLNLPSSEGGMTLGVCEAAIDLFQGDVPPGQRLKPTPDADRYYAVQSIQLLAPDKFWAQTDSELKSAGAHDALLYIHGYRSSFNDACRRAAQIAADLKFSGPVILWSWPSRDEVSGYFSDEKMAAWSSGHFATFLEQVLSQKGLQHLHIVAHSMGGRVLEQAIISPGITATEEAHLGQVIFAAPDLSRSAFDSECNPSRISALRITLYASRHDQALRAAKIAHPFPRLGDANPDIDIRPGMDSIDASAVDTSLMGHSYIGNSRGVLADVADLISSNAAPDSRQRLTRMGQLPRLWWRLNP